MKMISINRHGNDYEIYIEARDSYIKQMVRKDSQEVVLEYSKAIYGKYDQFWRTMGKFDTDTYFLMEPVELEQITYEDVKSLWEEIAEGFSWV